MNYDLFESDFKLDTEVVPHCSQSIREDEMWPPAAKVY